jgi:ribosomal subunit interface protein
MINIKIRSTNFDLTPAIEDYVSKKILSLQKYLDENDNVLCEVELGKTTGHHKTGDIFKAEVNIVESNKKQYFPKRKKTILCFDAELPKLNHY